MSYAVPLEARLELDRIRAYFVACRAKTPEQRAADQAVMLQEEERKHLHRVRARAAYMQGKKAPKPRRHRREAPKASPQYAALSTEAARDPRLGGNAVKLLTLVIALSGSTGYTDAHTGSLAGAIKVHPATVKRHLADLIEFGYLERQLRYDRKGYVVCRRLTPTDKAWPNWGRFHSKPEISRPRRASLPVTQKAKKKESPPDISDKQGAQTGASGEVQPKSRMPRRRILDRPPTKD